MEPIIDPKWIYIANTCEAIRTFCILSFFALMIVGLWHLIIKAEEGYGDPLESIKNVLKRVIPLFLTSIFLLIFIPSKDSVIKMVVAKYVTPGSIGGYDGEVEDLVDHIIEQIDKLDEDQGWG